MLHGATLTREGGAVPVDDQPSRRRLVSTEQAADAIGVDRTTLFRWVGKGKVLPAYTTPGGHMRWDIDDLKRQIGFTAPREEK